MDYRRHVFGIIKEIFSFLGMSLIISFPFLLWLFVAWLGHVLTL